MPERPLRLALIDNYDSYTHNLAHLLTQSNQNTPPTIILSDAYPTLPHLLSKTAPFDAYILSPGPGNPCNPRDFPLLERQILASHTPVLAVCLGHQALCAAHGATIARAPTPTHGAVSLVQRTSAPCPLLRGLPRAFRVVRYHSLHVLPTGMAHALQPTVWAEDARPDGGVSRVLMGVRHRQLPLFGLQFHPESVCTQFGHVLARNFLEVAAAFRALRRPARADALLAVPPFGRREGRGETGFRTRVRRLEISMESSGVFGAIFGAERVAFWLDSSSAVKSASSLSRCSSPETEGAGGEAAEREGTNAGEGGARKGRFSIMGACNGPLSELVTYDVQTRCVTVRNSHNEVRRHRDTSIFDYLSSNLARRYTPNHPDLPMEMNGGYVGFFGYELKAEGQGVRSNVHKSDLPDAWFVFADRFLVVDHEEENVALVAVTQLSDEEDAATECWFSDVAGKLGEINRYSAACVGNFTSDSHSQKRTMPRQPRLRFTPERSRSAYLEDINQCLHEITNGESYEICLTNRLRTTIPNSCSFDPLEVYCALRLVNPAPYSAFLRLDHDVAVCCSSPERYLQISSSGWVESKPIKGTLPRGRSLDEDDQLRNQLATSEKDRRENLMIVDLVRNDLSRTCEPGSVCVPKLMHVESYATVHQLVSTVTGQLSRNGATVDCIRSAYPMGSMTGAPKVRTMEIIDRLEHSARGIYSGSIGFLSLSGAADFNVVIRTAILNGHNVEIGVGGAIVAMSDPSAEYEEVILKGRAIMQSLALQVTDRSDYIIMHEQNEEFQEASTAGSSRRAGQTPNHNIQIAS